VPRLGVEVSGVARVGELSAPGRGELGGALEAAIGVVVARDHDRGEGQRIAGDGGEVVGDAGDEVRAFPVGGGDEKGAGDLAQHVRSGVGDDDRADRVGDDHHGAGGLHDLGDQAGDPGGALGVLPVGLLDAAGGRELGLPARLPVVGARAAVARQDDNVDVCDLHGGEHARTCPGVYRLQ
jgi:hypothetical protein